MTLQTSTPASLYWAFALSPYSLGLNSVNLQIVPKTWNLKWGHINCPDNVTGKVICTRRPLSCFPRLSHFDRSPLAVFSWSNAEYFWFVMITSFQAWESSWPALGLTILSSCQNLFHIQGETCPWRGDIEPCMFFFSKMSLWVPHQEMFFQWWCCRELVFGILLYFYTQNTYTHLGKTLI